MKVNVKRVMELGVNEKLQNVLGCLNNTVLLYVMGIIEYPTIGSFVYIKGEEKVTSEVEVNLIDYLCGRVYVNYKRQTTVYVNEDGKKSSWKKDGYTEEITWEDQSDWYNLEELYW